MTYAGILLAPPGNRLDPDLVGLMGTLAGLIPLLAAVAWMAAEPSIGRGCPSRAVPIVVLAKNLLSVAFRRRGTCDI